MSLEKKKALKFLKINIFLIILAAFGFIFCTSTNAQTMMRTPVKIPDIPGFLTLKCDFHMHTIFSDGTATPTQRTDEAWRDGLDAIAITDHIRTVENKRDTLTNYNQSSEIAKSRGNQLDIMVIKGLEVTTPEMPPGHLNTIFLKNGTELEKETWREEINEANNQGAFIFWNHPGWWDDMKKGDHIKWYPEHSEMFINGWLHGIEIVNDDEYYPEAYRWCLEKNLTILGNSDIHAPIENEKKTFRGSHRPMTLVFAKNLTEDAVKEALFSNRTAVYWKNMLFGKEEFLTPIFNNSITINNESIDLKEKNKVFVQITNQSQIDYELGLIGDIEEVYVPEKVILHGGKTILFEIGKKDTELKGEKRLKLPYKVNNLMIKSDKYLSVNLEILVNF